MNNRFFEWKQTSSNLIKQSIWLILAQMVPLIIVLVVHQLLGSLETYASFSLIDRINLTFTLIVAGFMQALFFTAGKEIGGKNEENYNQAITAGFIIGGIFSIILVALSASIGYIFSIIGMNQEIVEFSYTIGLILSFSIIPLILLWVIRVHLVLNDHSVYTTIVFALGSLIAFLLFYIISTYDSLQHSEKTYLILLASSFYYWIMLGLGFIFCKYLAPIKIQIKKENISNVLKMLWNIGWPIGLVICIENLSFLVAVTLIGKYWSSVVPVHSISILWTTILLTIPLGISQHLVKVIAIYHTRNNWIECQRTFFSALLITSFVSILVIYLFSNYSVQLGHLFLGELTNDSFIADWFKKIMPLAGILFWAESTIFVCVSALRGVGETKAPVFQAFLGYIVVASFGQYLLGVLLNLGAIGVWYGITFGFVITAIALLFKTKSLLFSH